MGHLRENYSNLLFIDNESEIKVGVIKVVLLHKFFITTCLDKCDLSHSIVVDVFDVLKYILFPFEWVDNVVPDYFKIMDSWELNTYVLLQMMSK